MELVGIVLATSFADSLNPIAIAQQFVLQGLVEKKNRILGFIVGIGLTNFIAGLLAYYGLTAIMERWLNAVITQKPLLIPVGQLLLGVGILVYLIYEMKRRVTQNGKKQQNQQELKEGNTQKNKKLSFRALFGLGVASCAMELTSALPYFAFLSLLVGWQLPVPMVVLVLAVYNVIYSLPLILLYLCSVYFEERLLVFYKKFSAWMNVVIRKVLPVALLIIALFLVWNGISQMLVLLV